jgi:hypothetical protein
MNATRKTSFIKTLLGAARRQTQPAKPVQPLDPVQLRQVAGGDGPSTNLPKGGW